MQFLPSSSLCNFSHPLATSSLAGLNNHLSAETFSLCSSHGVKVHILQPYTTTGKIILGRGQDFLKYFWVALQHSFLVRWVQFWIFQCCLYSFIVYRLLSKSLIQTNCIQADIFLVENLTGSVSQLHVVRYFFVLWTLFGKSDKALPEPYVKIELDQREIRLTS